MQNIVFFVFKEIMFIALDVSRWVTTHGRKLSLWCTIKYYKLESNHWNSFRVIRTFHKCTSDGYGCPRWLTTMKCRWHFSMMTITYQSKSCWFISFSENVINAMRYPMFHFRIVQFSSSLPPPVISFLEHVCHIFIDGPVRAFPWSIFISWQLCITVQLY